MEKRVKIYSAIIALIYLVIIASSIIPFINVFKTGFEKGTSDAHKDTRSLFFSVKVIPDNQQLLAFPDTLTNQITNTPLYVQPAECALMVPDVDNHPGYSGAIHTYEIIRSCLTLVFIGFWIYIPILFVQLIKSILRGTIMVPKTITRIKRMGWILIGVYLFTTVFYSVIDTLIAEHLVKLEGYRIAINLTDYPLLILGIVTLMLSEILKHTLAMKEEQDLTI